MNTIDESHVNYRKFGFNVLLETKQAKIKKSRTNKKNYLTEKERYESGEITRVEEREYTDDSLIYQSILEYSIDFGITEFFRSRKISEDWLLRKCPVYIKVYSGQKAHTKYKARAEHINPKVTECLENLKFLDLLKSRKAISDNKIETIEYGFTKLGRILGLLIKYMKLKKIDLNIVDKIYTETLTYYDDYNHSVGKFCSIFFRKCYQKDKRLFLTIINKLAEILYYATDDKMNFLSKLRNFQIFYNDPSIFQLFRESLTELGNKSQDHADMLLYHLKLEIEDIHEYKSRNLRSFEDLRYKVRTYQNKIAIEGYCNHCKQFIPCVVSLLEYLRSYIEQPDNSNRSECSNCLTGFLDFETLEFL